MLKPYPKSYFILFSKTGFTQELTKKVQTREDVSLISIEEM